MEVVGAATGVGQEVASYQVGVILVVASLVALMEGQELKICIKEILKCVNFKFK